MTTLSPRYKNLNGAPEGVLVSGMELSTLLASIGSEASELVINQNVIVSANTTIPSTLSVKVIKGSVISIATGVTLAINGYFECGLYQAFDITGTGRPNFSSGSVQQVYPEWYTADVTIASLCMQYAYDSLPAIGGAIYITKNVVLSAPLLCTAVQKTITIRGSGLYSASLHYDGAGGVINMQNGADSLLENFSITGTNVDDVGISIDGCYRVCIRKVTMQNRGLYLTGSQSFPPSGYFGVYWCTFENVKAKWIWLNNQTNGGGINANTFISCTTVFYNSTTNAGLTLSCTNGAADGCNTNTFVGCDFSYALGDGNVYSVFLSLFCDHNTFIGVYIEQSDKAIYNRGYDTSFMNGQINGPLAIEQAAQGNFGLFTVQNVTRQKSSAASCLSVTNTFTLANDTAINFTDINDISLLSVISRLPANSGIVYIYPGDNACTPLAVGANIATAITALTGTTGSVGKLTVSGNGGKTYIENRTGAPVIVSTMSQGIPANVS